ncbi:unnamed protein product [Durusdinium trenchii]|uniref:Calmodulin n=1 Tax=Durusdinium trenchii TaxID=1381693 RepID=A0ABP0NYJ0_9DINO
MRETSNTISLVRTRLKTLRNKDVQVEASLAALPTQRKLRPLLCDLEEQFKKHAGHDQALDQKELAEIWIKAAEVKVGKVSPEEAAFIEQSTQEYFQIMDTDKSGKVTYEEFVAGMLGGNEDVGHMRQLRKHLNTKMKDDPKQLQKIGTARADQDKNGDGYVSREELEAGGLGRLRKLAMEDGTISKDEKKQMDEVQKMINEMFSNADAALPSRRAVLRCTSTKFIAKLTVKECLAGLDGMRVALSEDDKIAMQEAQGSSELMDMILSGEKKPGRKKMQQNTDADEGAAPSKAFQFMPSSFGASKAGARNIQRCMEDLLNLYRLSFPLQNIFDEHGNVKSTGVAWEDTVKRSPEFFSSYFGHAKKGDRSALIFKHLEDIKRALMEKPARKHGFFKLLSEIPKGSRMMNDNVEILLYDISKGMAAKLGPLLLGKSAEAVHTGVLVYGSEYWYGIGLNDREDSTSKTFGSPSDLFALDARGGKLFRSDPPCRKQFGEPLTNPWGIQLERSEQRPDLPVVRLGYTFVTHEEFVGWLQAEVKERYTGLHTYDLLTHSCNHFSNEVCTFLLGQGIPEKIFELQKTFLSGPIVALRPFLNRYLGGFADHQKELDENFMAKDGEVEGGATAEDLKAEMLGSGDVVLVEGVDGIHGAVLATILKEEKGKCEIKYFDPTEHRIETMFPGSASD